VEDANGRRGGVSGEDEQVIVMGLAAEQAHGLGRDIRVCLVARFNRDSLSLLSQAASS
jgi:hypothetical protein